MDKFWQNVEIRIKLIFGQMLKKRILKFWQKIKIWVNLIFGQFLKKW